MSELYRTVVIVEVLSRGSLPEDLSLESVAYAITEGGCSGDVRVESAEVTGREMAELLRRQGSDPEFLGLTEEGEEVDG